MFQCLVGGIAAIFAISAGSAVAEGMIFPGDEWAAATPESQGVDSAKLKNAVDWLDKQFTPQGAEELVIIRNGYMIWEGPNIDAHHPIWSCTKTFTSAVLGLLIEDGKCTLDTLAVEHLPDIDDQYPVYGRIKLRHLASMTSGYRGQIGQVTPEKEWGNPMLYLIPAPPESAPGTTYRYNDHGVHLLGSILTRLAGEPVKELFKCRIAAPIGMTNWDWGVSGKVDGITLNNVSGVHGEGIQTTARELARFGHLFLNRGKWNGKQLISGSFVDQATTNQVPVSWEFKNLDLRGRYGLFWWTNGVKANGEREWASAPDKTYTAHGHNCNFCFVIPEWNMVIVRTGTISNKKIRETEAIWDTFFEKLAGTLDAPPNQIR